MSDQSVISGKWPFLTCGIRPLIRLPHAVRVEAIKQSLFILNENGINEIIMLPTAIFLAIPTLITFTVNFYINRRRRTLWLCLFIISLLHCTKKYVSR